MFGPAAWHRHRTAKAKAACERLVRELGGRAAVREAEALVESAWIDGLDRAELTDPTVRSLLERERASFTRAAHRRKAEAERDRQRLAAAAAEMAEIDRTTQTQGPPPR